ncbi:MAG: serine protease [SAR202 cluster bacterium]|nr:serine protease [SAR202 cluster bacterium]
MADGAQELADALVTITEHGLGADNTVSYIATGVIVSADGLILTVLDTVRPIRCLEVVVPGSTAYPASIVGFDPESRGTLLSIDASDLTHVSLESTAVPSEDEPVLLFDRHRDEGGLRVVDGRASPESYFPMQDLLFKLLPITNRDRGGISTIIANHDGILLGIGSGYLWYGTISPVISGPPPGKPNYALNAETLANIVDGHADLAIPDTPSRVALGRQSQSITRLDNGFARITVADPINDLLENLGDILAVVDPPQRAIRIVGSDPGERLEVVFITPQELRSHDGSSLGKARFATVWWNRGAGNPNLVLVGVHPKNIDAVFLVDDIGPIRSAVQTAVSGSTR